MEENGEPGCDIVVVVVVLVAVVVVAVVASVGVKAGGVPCGDEASP